MNKTILDLDLRKKSVGTVIGLKTPEKDHIINPEANSKLLPDTHLILLRRPKQIEKLRSIFKPV